MAQHFEYLQERRSSAWDQAASKRISWGAIFAGAVIAIACQMALTLLGMGIGFMAVNPASESNPFEGLGIGSIAWWSVSMLVSLYIGGWVAGRLAGIPRAGDGFLHGVLSWSVVTLASAFMVTTTLGVVMGGVGAVVGKTVSAGGRAASQAAAGSPQIVQRIEQEARQAAEKLEQKVDQAQSPETQQQARQTAEAATQGLGMATVGGFFALLLGALSAGFGGRRGAPKSLIVGRIPVQRGSAQTPVGSAT